MTSRLLFHRLAVHRRILGTFAILVALTSMRANSESEWSITANPGYTGYAPLTFANGFIGLTLRENPFSGNVTRLAGVYDRKDPHGVESSMPGIEFSESELIAMEPSAATDERADYLKGRRLSQTPVAKLGHWRQTVDLRHGTFRTEFEWEKLQLQHEVHVLRHLPHTVVIRVTMTALAPRLVAVRNTLSAPDPLRQPETRFRHQLREREIPMLTLVARSSQGRHTIASTATFAFAQKPAPVVRSSDEKLGQPAAAFQLELAAGESRTFYLVASTCTTQQFLDPASQTERLNIATVIRDPASAIAEHRRAWDSFWSRTDISVAGSPELTRDLRLAIFMLNSFVSERYPGTSTACMGLGHDFWGWQVLWDADFWMFPAVLLTNPDAARGMLDYRFARLDQARRNAAAYGYRGAMFPWQSGESGEEQTYYPYLTGPLQHHITAVVGWSFWSYFCVTQDKAWLKARGYPVLREVAEFWVSRVEPAPGGGYEIRHVVGPDEHAVDVHNDAFTNGMVKIVLRTASRAAALAGEVAPPAWNDVAERIVMPRFPDGTIKSHDAYAGEMIKQADPELLAFPLDLVNDPAEIGQLLRYYEPRVDPLGPNMTLFMYAGAAARAGNAAEAARLLDDALRPFRRPPFGSLSLRREGTSTYFGTSAGSLLQAVLLGFGGLHVTENGVVQRRGTIPSSWSRLTMRGIGSGQSYVVEAKE